MGGGGRVTKGSQIILREPVVIVENTDAVFLSKGTAGTVVSIQNSFLTILVEGKEYGGIPLESTEEVKSD